MIIRVNQLNFTYPKSDKRAVKGISFAVAEGEILGFLGPNGAGKSTTQKILTGLLKGYEGEVEVFGKPLNTWGHAYYEEIGVSFELPNHFLKLTAKENLDYFAALYSRPTQDINHLLEMVGLAEDRDTQVGRFSKGMKMRLNFARSLLHRPKLLFLDEPTSGLDPVNARGLKDIIRQLKTEGTTVFLTTHDMTVADELSDQVAFIVEGEIQAMDTPKSLKLQYGRREVAIEYRNGGKDLQKRVFALDNLGANGEFVALIQQAQIETIHTQETPLENIFIQVTGKELAS